MKPVRIFNEISPLSLNDTCHTDLVMKGEAWTGNFSNEIVKAYREVTTPASTAVVQLDRQWILLFLITLANMSITVLGWRLLL
jgi:hypothetical protein